MSFVSFSQSVSIISGFTNADAFTAVEPGNTIVYTAQVSNIPSDATYEWSVSNGAFVGVVVTKEKYEFHHDFHGVDQLRHNHISDAIFRNSMI